MVKVIINSRQDAAEGIPIVKEATLDNTKEATEFTIGILENGTEAGRTSLMFILKNPRWDIYNGAMHRTGI